MAGFFVSMESSSRSRVVTKEGSKMNTVSHNANQDDQRKETVENSSRHYQNKADNRGQMNTPRNSSVDVFEFEPTGFMSDNRW